MANVSLKKVLGMPFLTLSNADIDLFGRELRWRTYTTKKALPTTRRVELVSKKEFAATKLDARHETYIVNIGPQIDGLIAKEAFTKVPAKDVDFTDVFSPDLASKLPEYTKINDHAIELVNAIGLIRLSKSLNQYRCLRLRRSSPGQSVKSDRRRKRRLPHQLS